MITAVVLLNIVNLALILMLVLGIFTSLVQLNPWLIIAVGVAMLVTKSINVRVLRNAASSPDIR